MNYLSIILYAVLGFFLGVAGISMLNAPLEFCVIIIVVALIDLNSSYTMYKATCKDNERCKG